MAAETGMQRIATEVVYEDERVRVWRQEVPAGGEIPRHVHTNDYCLVNVSGTGPIAVDFHEGSGGSLGEHIEFSPAEKTASVIKQGHVETAKNLGDSAYHAILVEFL